MSDHAAQSAVPRAILRSIDMGNFKKCIGLEVDKSQEAFVASNVYSLAQAKANPRLHPFAIYDGGVFRLDLTPDDEPVGFVMYQIWDEVGFIMRLMIDRRHQRQGYGRATMLEVIRRLRLHPDVRYVSTSVHKDNHEAERFYRSLGFIDDPKKDPVEVYLQLPSATC